MKDRPKEELILSSNEYKVGDILKGKIFVNIKDELNHADHPNRKARKIEVYGVIRTVLE